MKGVLVSNTNMSDLNYNVFRELNISAKSSDSGVLLYLDLSTHLTHADFAIMNISEMNHFYGQTLVATCPKTADLLKKCPVNANKAYYIWDLSILSTPFNRADLKELLNDVRCICRSEDHKKIFKSLFGVNLEVSRNFTLGLF